MYTQYHIARITGLVIFYTILSSILVFILLLQLSILKPFDIVGTSMIPTYHNGDIVIAYTKTQIYSRGDTVVLDPEVSNDELYTKRIIGLPLETLKIKDGYVYLKRDDNSEFERLDEPYINNSNTYSSQDIFELGDDEYFVMGDNRLDSLDSRECFSVCDGVHSHYVNKEHILGKIVLNISKYLTR